MQSYFAGRYSVTVNDLTRVDSVLIKDTPIKIAGFAVPYLVVADRFSCNSIYRKHCDVGAQPNERSRQDDCEEPRRQVQRQEGNLQVSR